MPAKIDPLDIPLKPNFSIESKYWRAGLCFLAGIDEAGRGALAGPVAAGAVVFPAKLELALALAGVRDSKQMTPGARTKWAVVIKSHAVTWGIGLASYEEIDTLGILPATRLAASRAVDQLAIGPDMLLLDYLKLSSQNITQLSLVKGDRRSLSIAAASILAKTCRDALMIELDQMYPGYGFANHKGYGTAYHLKALDAKGPCPVHRKSFAPVRSRI